MFKAGREVYAQHKKRQPDVARRRGDTTTTDWVFRCRTGGSDRASAADASAADASSSDWDRRRGGSDRATDAASSTSSLSCGALATPPPKSRRPEADRRERLGRRGGATRAHRVGAKGDPGGVLVEGSAAVGALT